MSVGKKDDFNQLMHTVDCQLMEQREALEAARNYALMSRSKATWRAYESDWRIFLKWCAKIGLPSLPASVSTVAMFISHEAQRGVRASTINRRLAAIRTVHLASHLPSPTNCNEIYEVMKGIRRDDVAKRGGPNKRKPATDDIIKKLVSTLPDSGLQAIRDKAIILIGFFGAMRRSEIVGIECHHIEENNKGILIHIPISKSDQFGEGQSVAIPAKSNEKYCPVVALKDWLTVSGIEEGPVFRRIYRHGVLGKEGLSAQSIALIVKRTANQAEIDYSKLSAHSLRSGFLTSAARNRASLFKMADQSRHKTLQMVREYVRDEEKFDDNAGDGLLDEADNDV